MILKLGKSYVAFLKVLFLPLIGGLIYFSTSSKVNAANAPSLPLPPCETVDGVEMGACPVNDSDAVSASISGTFSAGNSVQVITEPTNGICQTFRNSEGFTPFPCASGFSQPVITGCFAIDFRNDNEFIEVNCRSLYRSPESIEFTFENEEGGACSGNGNFNTFIFGGAFNVPGAIWTERAPAIQRCNITLDSPRPDALIGPTWLRVTVAASIEESNDFRVSPRRRATDVFVPIDGDLIELPPNAAFEREINGRLVSFTNNSTSFNDSALTYAWDFGDGNTSTARNPEHIYETAGGFTVVLTVTDEDGLSDDTIAFVTTESRLAVDLEMESAVLNPGEENVINVTAYNFEAEDIEDFRLNLDFDTDVLTLIEDAAPTVLSSIATESSISTRYIIRADESGETNVTVTGEGRLSPSEVIVQDTAEKNITVNPDLAVTLSTSVNEFTRAGDEVTVTLTLVNNEDFTIDGIRVESLGISPNELLEFVSGPLDPDGNDPRVSPLALGAGETTTVTFTYIASQRGVVELTSTLASNNPFSGARVFQSTDTTLAIESAALEISELRLQPGRPVPGTFSLLRGRIENIGSLDITDINFEITDDEPRVFVEDEIVDRLDSEISPRIELLPPGEGNARDFIIPILGILDVEEFTRYNFNVTFTGVADVDGEESQVTITELVRGELDRSPYWVDLLDESLSLLLNQFISFIDGIDEFGDRSTLGGVTVGATEGALNAFQRMGDGQLAIVDLAGQASGLGGDFYTEQGSLLISTVIDYYSTRSRKQMLADLQEVSSEVAALGEDAALGAVDIFAEWMGDVSTSVANGDVRESSRLIASPATEVVAGFGVEQASARVFTNVLQRLPSRGVLRGSQKGPFLSAAEVDDILDAPGPNPNIQRRIDAEDALFDDVLTGVPLSARIAAAAGVDGDELAFMLRIAFERNVTFFVRPRPRTAARWAREGFNAKPLSVKLKSVNDIDIEWLGFNAGDEGLIVLSEPVNPAQKLSEAFASGELNILDPGDLEQVRLILMRYSTKKTDFENREAWLNNFNDLRNHFETRRVDVNSPSVPIEVPITDFGQSVQRFGETRLTTASIEPGTGRLIFDYNGKPVYSDIDLLGVGRRDGGLISPQLHEQILRETGFGFDGQHHATAQTSDFPKASIARNVADEFLSDHSIGGEGLLIIGPEGITKGFVNSYKLIDVDQLDTLDGLSNYDLYGRIVENITYTGVQSTP